MHTFRQQEKSRYKIIACLFVSLAVPLLLLGCGGPAKQDSKKSPSTEAQNQGASSAGRPSLFPNAGQQPAEQTGEDILRWGFIDKSGKVVIKPKYERVAKFSEGLAGAQVYGLWGFIDPTGKWIIKIKYPATGPFKGGLAAVLLDKNWGFITKTGVMQIPPIYQAVHDFSEHKAAVKQWSWGFIDERGGMIIKPTYQDAGSFSEGLAAVQVKDKWGYIDVMNKMIIQPKYASAGPFIDSLARVALPADPAIPHGLPEEAIIDKNCMERILTPIEQRENFSEGLALFKRHENWGFIDSTGQVVIKAHYNWAENFSEHLACVKRGFKKGYIDLKGNFVIEPQFEDAQSFSEGLAAVLLKSTESDADVLLSK